MSPWKNKGWEKAGAGDSGEGTSEEIIGYLPPATPYSLPFETDVEGLIRGTEPYGWTINRWADIQGVVATMSDAFFRFSGYRRAIQLDANAVNREGCAWELGAVLPAAGWKIEVGWRGGSVPANWHTGIQVYDTPDPGAHYLVCDLQDQPGLDQLGLYSGVGVVIKDTVLVPQVPSTGWNRPTKCRFVYTGATRTFDASHYKPDFPLTWSGSIDPVHGDVDTTGLKYVSVLASITPVTHTSIFTGYLWVGALTAAWPTRPVEGGAPS